MSNNFYPIDRDRIPEAVEKVNQLRNWFNDAAPKIIDALKDCKTIAAGSQLSKRDKAKVEPILATAPKGVRTWFQVSPYSVWFTCDITYKDSDHSCNYHDENCIVGDKDATFTPRNIMTAADVIAAIYNLGELRKEQDKLEDRISEVVSIIRPFGKR